MYVCMYVCMYVYTYSACMHTDTTDRYKHTYCSVSLRGLAAGRNILPTCKR